MRELCLGFTNPVGTGGVLDICLWVGGCMFKIVGPGLVSTSAAFVSSSASHPVGPHAHKTVNGAPIVGGRKV